MGRNFSSPVNVISSARGDLPLPGRYELPLLESRRESPTAMTFRFSTGGTSFRYLSNQFIRLGLPEVDDPWGAARLFSLSSSPSESGQISVTCRISDTPFKQALSKMQPGERAEVRGPFGDFVFDRTRPAVFLAGGIGITPLRGMIRFAHDTRVDKEMILLYSARTPEELVFRHEFDRISDEGGRLKIEYSVTRPEDSPSSWAGRVGRIDRNWIREATTSLERPRYYLCGLPEMVREMILAVRDGLGVSEEDIEYEVFRGF